MMGKIVREHSFSVEMKSQNCVKRISFLDQENGHVFFEGFLGELTNIAMVEGVMLEIKGNNGILRLDITRGEMEKCFAQKSANQQAGEKQ